MSSSSLTKEKLITSLQKLSAFMSKPSDEFEAIVQAAQHGNAWFTPIEVNKSLQSLSKMLNEDDLALWFKDIKLNEMPKKVGLILAGNIPLVGFHDVICVLATGNIALIKMSSSDDKILPALLNKANFFRTIIGKLHYICRTVKRF